MGKRIFPCTVKIERFYRVYVAVDEEASNEDIIAAAKAQIVEEQDAALTDDPDMEIEEHDIVAVNPDYEASWPDDPEEDEAE